MLPITRARRSDCGGRRVHAGVERFSIPPGIKLAVANLISSTAQLWPRINYLIKLLSEGFLSDLTHPFARHDFAQPFSIPFTTYWESLCNTTEVGFFSEFKATIQAINSIRLFVVKRYPPDSSFEFPLLSMTAP